VHDLQKSPEILAAVTYSPGSIIIPFGASLLICKPTTIRKNGIEYRLSAVVCSSNSQRTSRVRPDLRIRRLRSCGAMDVRHIFIHWTIVTSLLTHHEDLKRRTVPGLATQFH